ncbi:MAG: citryl-CoA lyase [Candidatus Diapherotrites archaeon]|nr:citryl-CoA lyase [Candidatus Diapherotrites archaeon]
MKFVTEIGYSSPKKTIVRGHDIQDLVKNNTFTEGIFLTWQGRLPNEKERKMLDAILVSCMEHGPNAPTILSSRIVASAGNSLNASVAAGVLSVGEHHGGAIEQCAKLFQEQINQTGKQIVKEFEEKKKRIPGYGHKIYTTDPRTVQLLEIAQKLGFFGKFVKLSLEIEKELETLKGKKLCLNVDGCIAALMSELGFSWQYGKGFFIISRTTGIIAHAVEETVKEKPFRRLDESEVEYIGKK